MGRLNRHVVVSRRFHPLFLLRHHMSYHDADAKDEDGAKDEDDANGK